MRGHGSIFKTCPGLLAASYVAKRVSDNWGAPAQTGPVGPDALEGGCVLAGRVDRYLIRMRGAGYFFRQR